MNKFIALAVVSTLGLIGCGGTEEQELSLGTAEMSLCTSNPSAPASPPECFGRCVQDSPQCAAHVYPYYCDASGYGISRCAFYRPNTGTWAFSAGTCERWFQTTSYCN